MPCIVAAKKIRPQKNRPALNLFSNFSLPLILRRLFQIRRTDRTPRKIKTPIFTSPFYTRSRSHQACRQIYLLCSAQEPNHSTDSSCTTDSASYCCPGNPMFSGAANARSSLCAVRAGAGAWLLFESPGGLRGALPERPWGRRPCRRCLARWLAITVRRTRCRTCRPASSANEISKRLPACSGRLPGPPR